MRRHFFALSLLCLLPLGVYAAGEPVVINEVFFNPAGTDTGFEYVVLKNTGSETVTLTSWELYPDGIGYFVFPAFSLSGGARVTIVLRASGQATSDKLYHASASGNMGNTSGSVALFSSSAHSKDTIKDFVQYGKSGKTWESAAADAGLWTKGDAVLITADEEGKALRRAVGSGMGVSLWSVADQSTQVLSEENPIVAEEATSEVVAGGKVYSGPAEVLKIRAFAGNDRRSIASADALFEGKALGWQDDLLESEHTRFFWNFGDGATGEGKNTRHNYSYPGTYIATLYIVSGEQTARDDIKITVVENPLMISKVAFGVDGFIEIFNPSGEGIDISGWHLGSFTFPPRTLIASKARTVFAAGVTRINAIEGGMSLVLTYPNGKIATTYKQDKKIVTTLPIDIPREPIHVPIKVSVATTTVSKEVLLPPEPLAASIGEGVLPTGGSHALWLFGSVAVGIAVGFGVIVIQRAVFRA
ncbi:MAG: PKD domain-containing protein [Candidatus Ryanbacteria bacterium]|nr:PKD domain-containing protein [Candidatus Ryanbacteria bacterium]